MSLKTEGASLITDDKNMNEQPGPSSSSPKRDFQEKGKENEGLPGKGEENGGKQEFRSPKTTPMLPPEV